MKRAIISIAFSLAAACMANVAAAQSRDIVIGLSSGSLATAPARIAKELGLYEKHGLNVKFSILENASVANAALVSRSVNFTVGGPQELVVAQGRGIKIVAVANVYGTPAGSLVISRAAANRVGLAADAPVASRLKALDGLLVGSPQPTSSYTFMVKSAAAAAGATPRFTFMAMPAMAAALKSGAIDAYIASAPFWAPPVIEGYGLVWMNGPRGDFPPEHAQRSFLVLQAMRDYAEANADTVRRTAAVFSDFIAALDTRPNEVKAIAARLFPDLPPEAFDLLYAAESLGWKAKPLTVEDMAHLIDLVKSTGVQLPDLDRSAAASLLFP